MSLCLILFCSWGKTVESFEKGLGAVLFFITFSGCITILHLYGAINLQSSSGSFEVALASAVLEHRFKQQCRTVVCLVEYGSCWMMCSHPAQEGKDREGMMQNPVETAGKIWVGRMQFPFERRGAVNNENLATVDTCYRKNTIFLCQFVVLASE